MKHYAFFRNFASLIRNFYKEAFSYSSLVNLDNSSCMKRAETFSFGVVYNNVDDIQAKGVSDFLISCTGSREPTSGIS